jgi:glycosyltransferase 2 family protein
MTEHHNIKLEKVAKGTHQAPVSRRYVLLSLGISILSMAAVIWYTYEPGMLERISPKRLPGLGIALVVSMLRVFFIAAKMRFLSERTLSWAASFRVALSWDFASMVMPSTIGGAPMATYAMSCEGISIGKSTALTLYAMLLDQLWFVVAIPILLIAGVYYEIAPESVGTFGEGAMLMLYVAMLLYAAILAYGVLINPEALKKMVSKLFRLPFLRKHRARMEAETDGLVAASHELRAKSYVFLLKGFLISSLGWLSRIWVATIIVLSFVPADVGHSFLRSLAMHLAGLLMPTPGGSGGLEGLFVLFQGPFMGERDYFIGIAVFMWRFIGYYITFAMGMFAASWYVNRSVALRNNNGNGDNHNQTAPS